MGRMVEPPRRLPGSHQEGVGAGGDQASGGDGFLERVVKYVPAEIIAAYMTLDRIVAADSAKHHATFLNAPDTILKGRDLFDYHLPGIVFAGMLIMVFVYFFVLARLGESRGADRTWFWQASVSAVVFVVWAYATKGSVFELNGLFVDKYAAMLVPVVTLLSGIYRPSPVDADAALQAAKVLQSGAPKSGAPSSGATQTETTVVAIGDANFRRSRKL